MFAACLIRSCCVLSVRSLCGLCVPFVCLLCAPCVPFVWLLCVHCGFLCAPMHFCPPLCASCTMLHVLTHVSSSAFRPQTALSFSPPLCLCSPVFQSTQRTFFSMLQRFICAIPCFFSYTPATDLLLCPGSPSAFFRVFLCQPASLEVTLGSLRSSALSVNPLLFIAFLCIFFHFLAFSRFQALLFGHSCTES